MGDTIYVPKFPGSSDGGGVRLGAFNAGPPGGGSSGGGGIPNGITLPQSFTFGSGVLPAAEGFTKWGNCTSWAELVNEGATAYAGWWTNSISNGRQIRYRSGQAFKWTGFKYGGWNASGFEIDWSKGFRAEALFAIYQGWYYQPAIGIGAYEAADNVYMDNRLMVSYAPLNNNPDRGYLYSSIGGVDTADNAKFAEFGFNKGQWEIWKVIGIEIPAAPIIGTTVKLRYGAHYPSNSTYHIDPPQEVSITLGVDHSGVTWDSMFFAHYARAEGGYYEPGKLQWMWAGTASDDWPV